MPKERNPNTDEIAVPRSLERLRREMERAEQRLADEHARQLARARPEAQAALDLKHEIERQELAEKHRQQLEEFEARGDLPRPDKAVDDFNTAVSAREMEDAQDDIQAHEERKRREAERARELERKYLDPQRGRDKGLDR